MKSKTLQGATDSSLATESVIAAAVRLAGVFAGVLRRAQPGRPLVWSARDREGVRAAAEQLCSPALPLVVDRTARRWQALLDIASSRLPATTRRRPDVLSLARDALALPEHPHTRTLFDFAICAKLRELYGVGHSLADLELLRQSFEDLAQSFEGRQRRRVKKDWGPHAHLLLDIASMSGHVWRAPDAESFDAYCEAFSTSPFGVASGRRTFGSGHWPELFGEPPQFGTVLRRAYGIPLGVPGLDDALGALQLPFPGPEGGAGVLTLVCGPTGSGRTTLLSQMASALSELGFSTSFLSAHESTAMLEDRLRGLAASTPASLWSRWLSPSTGPRPRLEVTAAPSMAAFAEAVRALLPPPRRGAKAMAAREPHSRAVFVDGIPDGADSVSRGSKPGLADALVRLRASGACVFVTCTDADRETLDLDRYADNVFALGFHPDAGGRRTTRVLSVDKTRLQSSQRDRHVLNVGEAGGCWVSPSLHTVNRGLPGVEPSSARLFHLPHRAAEGSRRATRAPSLREGAQVLVFGPGQSGKAALALACALAPAAHATSDEQPEAKRGQGRRRTRTAPPRTLVVSFLYSEPHYRKLAARTLRGDASPPDTLSVWTLYPGYLDAETFVSKLQEQFSTAELLGRPFESVVLDGIHNLALEFPLLRSDDLLWPTLMRLLRSAGLRTVSTFSSFGADAPSGSAVPALMSTCDYVLEMRRDEAPRSGSRAQVRVVASASDGLRVGDLYHWEDDALSFAGHAASATAR